MTGTLRKSGGSKAPASSPGGFVSHQSYIQSRAQVCKWVWHYLLIVHSANISGGSVMDRHYLLLSKENKDEYGWCPHRLVAWQGGSMYQLGQVTLCKNRCKYEIGQYNRYLYLALPARIHPKKKSGEKVFALLNIRSYTEAMSGKTVWYWYTDGHID